MCSWDVLELLECFDPALNRGCFVGLGTKAVDKALHALALLLDVAGSIDEDLLLFSPLFSVLVVVAGVLAHRFRFEAHDTANLLVEELAIVGDEAEGAVVAVQEVAEPGHARHVQVVGRLVQEQQVVFLKQERGQDGAHFPTSTELIDVSFALVVTKTQAGEDSVGFVLGKEPVEVIDLFVQLGNRCCQLHEPLIPVRIVFGAALFGGEILFGLSQALVQRAPAGHTR